MSDRISLTGITGHGRHGVYEHEREHGQRYVVDLELRIDALPAGHTDELRDTVDYGAVARRAVEIIEGEPVRLIETLAQRIADAVLTHERVEAVEVTVHKPHAPVAVPLDDIAVTIERSRRT